MSSKPIVAVVGATGNQGRGLVRDLLEEGTFAVRGLTRNPNSGAGRELSGLGVEIVQADVDDAESLTVAFKGAYGVYGNTDFWQLLVKHTFDQSKAEEHEVQQGKNIVDAAKAAGVAHFVWSTLDHFDAIKVFHFESKARVADYLATSGIQKYTLLYTSAYFGNISTPGIAWMNKPDEGEFILDIPIPTDTKMHFFDPADVGQWVVPILTNPAKYSGRVDAVAEFISPREFAATLKRVTGVPFTLVEVTKEEFYKPEYREKVGDEIWLNMLAWEGGYVERDMKASRAIAPNAKNLETFLRTDPATRSYLGLSKTGSSA